MEIPDGLSPCPSELAAEQSHLFTSSGLYDTCPGVEQSGYIRSGNAELSVGCGRVTEKDTIPQWHDARRVVVEVCDRNNGPSLF